MFYTDGMVSERSNEASFATQPLVVSLSKYIAYPGIAHAGGQYLNAQLAAVRKLARVRLFAPDAPLNREAVEQQAEVFGDLLPSSGPKLRGLWFRLMQAESVLAGSSTYWPVRRVFRGERAPWAQLAAADVIELQWSEMIALAPLIRVRLPEARLIGVAHDVITQRWQREAEQSKSALRRSLARFAARRAAKREKRSFDALDALLVFSEKDAALVRELGSAVETVVVHPGLGPKVFSRAASSEPPTVLFVGALNRPENDDAALWLLRDIWPHVLEQAPDLQLVIAGAHPSPALRAAAANVASVQVTGFVDNLTPLYEQATVCVVPLRFGAGVKFKTIDAMLFEVPVVSTSVGAEGIDRVELFAGVVDDAVAFAQAVCDVASETQTPLRYREQAKQARAWAEQTYGQAQFEQTIASMYGAR